MSRPHSSVRRPDIQGLRAVAVLLVVLDHAGGWPSGGYIGVDVFFVISGFVITQSLLRERARTGTVSLRAFLVRRVRRLLPSAVVVAIATIALFSIVFTLPRALATVWDGASAITSAANWRLIRLGTDYFAGAGAASPFQHYWSLSVEEQFYAAWPVVFVLVLMMGAARTAQRRLAIVVGLLTIASFAIAMAESLARPAWAYFALEARAWELGVGILLALVPFERLRSIARRDLRAALALGGAALIVVGALVLDGSSLFPGPWALLPVLGAAAIIAAGTPSSGGHEGPAALVLDPLRTRAMTWIGDVSYPVYLWHYPLIVLAAGVWPQSRTAVVAAVLATFGLAAATHRWIELPFQGRRRSPGPPRPTPSTRSNVLWGAGAVLTIGALSAVQLVGPARLVEPPDLADPAQTAIAAAGASHSPVFVSADALESAVGDALAATQWPDLTPSLDRLGPSAGAARHSQLDGCLAPASTSIAPSERLRSCSYGDPEADKTVVVFGDSIAVSWLPAVRGALAGSGWRVSGLGIESCPPAAVTVDDRARRRGFAGACDDAREQAVQAVIAERPDVVIVSGAQGSFDRLVESSGMVDARGAWTAGLRATAERFERGGARVVVLGAPPETAAPASCANTIAGPVSCERLASDHTAVLADLADDALDGVGLAVDTRRWFCDADGRCPAFVDGTVVTTDGGHLTAEFAARLSRVVAQSVTADDDAVR